MKERREYKYLLDENGAARVRDAIAGICVPDEHAGHYLIDTLYLDTLGHHLYRATIENEPIRHKLRIRTYPGAASPVFLEVKRRIDDVIIKSRAALRGDWVRFLDTGDLDIVEPAEREAAEQFLAYYQTNRGGAVVPAVLVRYEREAYTSTLDDYARVTFDRKIQFQPHSELSLVADERAWTPIDDPIAMRSTGQSSACVLELKFGPRAPTWLWQLVQRLELARLAFSKYTRSIDSMLYRPLARFAEG
ncbi:MAG TPA: polyphosphate polymerase domain-containing protein [Kofleriaceae bacterium]